MTMRPIHLLLSICCLLLAGAAHAEPLRVAAASDLKFALDEIVDQFSRAHPGDRVDVIYGSSGKMYAQIQQGAPYDLYFSADIAYPRELRRLGHAGSEVQPYAIGRIVLWSAQRDAARMTLASLADPGITRIAIANPRHAPYGKRAEEALRAAGLWQRVKPKLVYGETVAHATQFVQSGNAQVGIIALALVLNPKLASQGGYYLIPDQLHQPLEQGFMITRRARDKPLARRFSDYVTSPPARQIMVKYGFKLPDQATRP